MSIVIVFKGIASGGMGNIPSGSFLMAYNPEANRGRGLAEWTLDRKRAMKFATMAEAFDVWRAVPSNVPTRPDGKPNRPLTAFTVEFEDSFIE